MKTTSRTPAQYIGLLALMFCFQIFAYAQNGEKHRPGAETELTTAKATVAAYANEEWEDLRSYLTPDAKIYGLGSFDSLTADETIAYWTQGSQTASPTLKDERWLIQTIEEGPKKGKWVYHWGTNTLNYKTGEKISFPYHIALKVERNKVSEAHFYYDNMKIIRHLGYALSPPLLEDQEEDDLDLMVDFETEKKN